MIDVEDDTEVLLNKERILELFPKLGINLQLKEFVMCDYCKKIKPTASYNSIKKNICADCADIIFGEEPGIESRNGAIAYTVKNAGYTKDYKRI